MKLKKGQKVWIVFPNYSRKEASIGEYMEIAKVGPKYATIITHHGTIYKFKATIWEKHWDNRAICDTNYPAVLYESESSWNEEKRRMRLRNVMADFCRNFIYNKDISTEKIEKILEILEIKVE